MITAAKLGFLVSHFSKAKVLFANEYNYKYLVLMLEILNNIVQYQFESLIERIWQLSLQATGMSCTKFCGARLRLGTSRPSLLISLEKVRKLKAILRMRSRHQVKFH